MVEERARPTQQQFHTAFEVLLVLRLSARKREKAVRHRLRMTLVGGTGVYPKYSATIFHRDFRSILFLTKK